MKNLLFHLKGEAEAGSGTGTELNSFGSATL
jgi:hypothetical protein